MEWYPVNQEFYRYLRDESGLTGRAERICFPESEEEAAGAFREARAAGKTLTIQGGCTGLAGGAVPEGGWIVNLSRMDRTGPVLEMPDKTAEMSVQAGVTMETVQKLAGAKGYFYPPDPTEKTATVGGMFATGAGGAGQLGYGTALRYVKSLCRTTPEGKIEHCRGDGMEQMFGSAGARGAILSLTLCLLPLPKEIWGVFFFFPGMNQAVSFGKALLSGDFQKNRGVTAAEYYGGGALDFLRAHMEHPLLARIPDFPESAAAALYLELSGEDSARTEETLSALLDLFEIHGGTEADTWAETGFAGIQKFRDLRHTLVTLLNETPTFRDDRGLRWELDFQGKPEEFPCYLQELSEICRETGIHGAFYGHLLCCRLHLALLPGQDRELCRRAADRLTRAVRDMGGTLWAEYGVGKRNTTGNFEE